MPSRKMLYWIGSILAGLCILALLIQLIFRQYLEPRIGKLLEDIIVKGSDSLYTFRQGHCSVGIWTGSVALTDCQLTMDSTRFDQRKKDGTLPALTLAGHLTEIKVTGFSLWRWIRNKKVDCSSLTIVGASVSLYRHPGSHRDHPVIRKVSPDNLYALIQGEVHSIRLGNITLSDLQVSYDNGDSAKPFRWSFERCDLRLHDILVDSTTVSDSTRIAYAEGLDLGLKKISFLTGNGLYRLSLDAVAYDFKNRTALLSSFDIHPILAPTAFYKKVGHQQDRFSLQAPVIKLWGINVSELLQFNLARIDSGLVAGLVFRVMSDRTVPPSGISKMGNFPSQLLLKSSMDLMIRTLRIEKGSFYYEEKNAKTKKIGTLSFEHAHGLLTNVTNVSDNIVGNPWWRADLHADFLGHSPVDALFSFDLRSPAGAFTLRATVKDMDAAALNPVTMALANASVRSFHLRELSFLCKGDERVAKGDLRMQYDHLNLELLRTDPDSGRVSKKPVLSFLVKELGIQSDNPSGNKAERMALSVTRNRDQFKSFFSLIWKTLFMGIRTIALKGILKPK